MSSGHEQSTCVKERCGLSSRPLPLKVCSCFALTMDADHQVVLFEHQPLVRVRVRVRVRARARVRVRARARARARVRVRVRVPSPNR